MSRIALAAFIPPLAVCRYGCAGCCAAPIGVFWLAGIFSVAYGFFGGPAGLDHISWTTILLGAGLWTIASFWALNVISGIKNDQADPKCQQKRSNLCSVVTTDKQLGDPMDEIKKFTS